MPTQHGITYNSGNVASLGNIDLVSNIIPNKTYDFSFNGIVHLKNDSGDASGLLYSNTIDYAGSPYTFGTNIASIETPSDNVSVQLELIRNNNNIYVHVVKFNSDYASYNYDFDVRMYYDTGITSLYKNTNLYTGISNTTSSFPLKSFTSVSSITTTPYYFAVNNFYNQTAISNVYANISDANANTRLVQPVFDVRGLAYFRDGITNYTATGENLSNLAAQGQLPSGKQVKLRLSSDGSVMLMVLPNISTDVSGIYLFKKVSNGWVLTDNIPNVVKQYTSAQRYYSGGTPHYASAALSGDAKRCVVACEGASIQTNKLTVYDINDTLNSITAVTDLIVPSSYNVNGIHEVSMSMDGKTILISGADSSGTIGYAHVYTHDGSTWNLNYTTDLSSVQMNDYVSQYRYGADSTISGDGKTVAVFGSKTSSNTNTGYIWKINSFDNNWMNTQKVVLDYTLAAQCKLSHLGDLLFVCVSNKVTIFDTTNGNTPLFTQTISNAVTGSMSGDGSRYMVVHSNNTQVTVGIRTSDTNTWNTSTIVSYPQFLNNAFIDMSFDGSVSVIYKNTFLITSTDSDDIMVISGDKTDISVSQVLDYMYETSSFFYFDYNFNYSTDIYDWKALDSTTPISETGINSYGYGYFDNTAISADGRFILAGAPHEKKVYLYDTFDGNWNKVYTFSNTSTYFGVRCAMNDLSTRFAIVDNTKIHLYVRDNYNESNWFKNSFDHGYTQFHHFKMSKYGTTIIMSEIHTATSFKKWTLSNDYWDANTNTAPTPDTKTGTKVGACDLSADGSIIVAAEQSGQTQAYLSVFWGVSDKFEHSLTVRGHLHSVAISGVPDMNNEYTVILGETKAYGSTTMTSCDFRVITFHKDTPGTIKTDSLDTGNLSISGLFDTRYGRYATMSYDGRYAMLSGTREDVVAEYHIGGAVLIDMVTKTKLENFSLTGSQPYWITSGDSTVAQFPTSQDTDTLQDRWVGFGSGCRISSDNKKVIVTGGGLINVYSSMDILFSLQGNGTSLDGNSTFTGGGDFTNTGYATLNNTTMSVTLNTGTFQFNPSGKFNIDIDLQVVNLPSPNSNVIRIQETNGAFDIRVIYIEQITWDSGYTYHSYLYEAIVKQNGSEYINATPGSYVTPNLFDNFNKIRCSFTVNDGSANTLEIFNNNITYVTNSTSNTLTGLDFGTPPIINISTIGNIRIKNFNLY